MAKDPGQMTLKERREYVNVLEKERDLQDDIINKELAKLSTMRKGSDMYKRQLEYVNSLQDKWSSLSRTVNEYNTELDKGAKASQKASDNIQSLSESLQDATSKVPILGKYLSEGVQKATDKAKLAIDNWVKDSDGRIKKGFKKTGLVLGGLLLGTVVGALAGFFKLLGKAKDEMVSSSAALTDVGRQLQMSKEQVKEIGDGVGRWQHYGAPWAGAIAQIKEDMGFIPKFTKEENKLVAKLAANAGLSAEHIGSMYRHSQNLGMSLTDYTTEQAKKIQNLNLEMGLHTTQAEVVAEIASASDETLAMFGRQNAELEKQVLIGKKIGLNLNQQASMAKSLLDIESSIEAEMEARVLTGRELNFDKARELALNGDISGASQEIMDQVGGITEFNKMNIIQKEALAKAAGMEVGAMQKSMEMQAGLPDQADPGGGGLATGNVSMDDRDAARSRRWGTLLEPLAKALDALKIAVGDKLYAWFNTGPGKTILEDIQTHLVHFVNWLSGTGPQPEWITTVKKGAKAVGDFFTDHGKNILLALGIGGAIGVAASIYEKVRGSTRLLPMYVSLVGGLGNMGKRISNWMRKGKKSGWRRNLLAKAKRATRVGGSGGGIFGKAYRGIKGAGQKAMGGIKSAGTKFKGVARSLNPLAALKKAFSGNAGKFMKKALGFGGKFAKGGLLGALLNAKFLYDIVSNPKLNPMDKAKGVIQLGSSIIGGGIGAIAGSIVGPVGTFGGGMLGSLIGDWIGSMPAIQNALAPPLSKAFKGEEVAEDFILSGRGIQRFRKDDLVIGGTRLNEALGTGDNKRLDEVASLLKTLIEVTREDRVMSVDGKELANALAETANYRGVA